MYLCIENPAVAPLESFTMFGVSSARGKAEKIGQFGSGAKHGVSICLRHAITPIIYSGSNRIEFSAEKRQMADTEYDQVIAFVNGERKELSYATQFGELDWQDFSMSLREFYSNALDSGGLNVFEIAEPIAAPGKTRVFLELTKEVATAREKMKSTFLHLTNQDKLTVIRKETLTPIKIYRKGVLVYTGKPEQLSMFDYNSETVRVNESRQIDSYMVDYVMGTIASKCPNTMKSIIRAVVTGVSCMETKYPAYYTGIALFNAWNEVFPDKCITLNEPGKNEIAVPALWFDKLQQADVPIGKSRSITAMKKGLMEQPVSKEVASMVKRVWNKLEKIGMTNNKEMPGIRAFSVPMNNGVTLHGYAEENNVYFNVSFLSKATIIEELGHYITGAFDETRDFQDWAFEVASRLI